MNFLPEKETFPYILLFFMVCLFIIILSIFLTHKDWSKLTKSTENMSIVLFFMIGLFLIAAYLLIFQDTILNPQANQTQTQTQTQTNKSTLGISGIISKIKEVFNGFTRVTGGAISNILHFFSDDDTLMYTMLFITACLLIPILFICINYKEWTNNPTSIQNTTIILTFLTLGMFCIIAIYLYKLYPEKFSGSINSIKNLPSVTKKLLQYKEFRYKVGYLFLFFAFVLLCILLNGIQVPFLENLKKEYFGLTTFVILFVASFFIGILLYYTYSYNYASSTSNPEPTSVNNFFLNSVYILFSLGLSIALIAWTVISVGSLNSTAHILSLVGNIALIVVLFAIVYRIININSYIKNSPIVRLILNSIFYVPCLLINVLEFFYQSKKIELVLFVLSILLLVFIILGVPYLEKKFYIQGGTLLLNEPVYLDNYHLLTDYSKLNPKAIDPSNPSNVKYEYNYALSMWIYIDSNNKIDGSGNIGDLNSYKKIFDYGGKPAIYYDPFHNTMSILEVSSFDKASPDVTHIYEEKNVKLQKWNHVIFNYNAGTLDIFYNGKLVKSQPNVTPYMELDSLSVGSVNGLNGAICNVTYFDKVLTIQKINYLYESLKNSTPPTSMITASIMNMDANQTGEEAKELTTGIIVTSVVTVVSILAALLYT